jgi:hypothetical protein
MASVVFGRQGQEGQAERQIGKIIVLGCGYGMSAAKFGAFCELAAPTSRRPDVRGNLRRDLPRHLFAGSRAPRGRGATGRAASGSSTARRCGRVSGDAAEAEAGGAVFYRDGGALVIWLPSGRRLYYRNARIEPRVPGWALMQQGVQGRAAADRRVRHAARL